MAGMSQAKVNERVYKFVPYLVVQRELAKHPRVKAVLLWAGMWDENEQTCAKYLGGVEVIVLDPTVSPTKICKINNERFLIEDIRGFVLEEDEAWEFVFCHEAFHSDGNRNEAEADRYAVEQILKRRAFMGALKT